MRIGITERLFLSILAATCLAILSLFLIMRWSIDRGFYQYLNTLDQSRLEQMSKTLEDAYAEHGNWDFLRNSPGFWIKLLMNTHADESARLKEPGESMVVPPGPPHPMGGRHRPRFPLVILDADRQPIFGSINGREESNFRPVVHEGKTVGYVGLLSPRHFLHPMQVRFLSQQSLALALAALGMAMVVAIVSLPLAKRLVRPIKAMAAATHDIASGKYTTRIPVTSSDELGQLGRDFNAMAMTLEKHEQERRQSVADISHELRTPVAVLRGEIEALLDGVRAVSPDTIRSLHAETLRLNRLVEDLYQLSLSDISALSYHKENLDLVQALASSLETFRAEFGRKGIALTSNIDSATQVPVFADRERLDQLFANLFENSLKYTDPGGELAVSMTAGNGRVIIDFQDSKPGVPDEDLERLFDRLYRVEGSRSRASGGAGLGLAISKNIVEAHEGTISAHRSTSGGLLIRIELPIAGS